MLTCIVFESPFFPIKTASESQIKELLKIKRTPVDQAEVEKLIKEKNVVGSYKSRLKGTRIFSLILTLNSHSMSSFAPENSTSVTQNRLLQLLA